MPGALLWGWDDTNKKHIPLAVDANGYVKVDMSNIKLNDLADVSVATPTDGYVLYWDNATSLWKCKAAYASPTTTAGDIIKRGAAADQRLAIGSAGQVLTVVTGAPAWSAAPGGTKIQDADGDTSWDVEQSADEDKVHGKVKGVEAFLLNDAGVLTLAKQSAVVAYANTSQDIPDGDITKLQHNVELKDIQAEFDPVTNYRYTAKTVGIYAVFAKMAYNIISHNGLYTLHVRKNGTTVAGVGQVFLVGTYPNLLCGALIDLAVDDELEFWTYQNSTATQDTWIDDMACQFSLIKVA